MLNTAYQLTDGGGKAGGNKKTGKATAGITTVIANNSNKAVNTAVNTLKQNNAIFKAEQAKAAPVATKTASAVVHKGSSGGSSGGGGAAVAVAAPTYQETGYTPSQTVSDAYAKLEALQAPTYNNKFEAQLSSLYDQILNRPKFSYNVNADKLYQQYRDQYTQAGQTAMRDTMAQASALTGGYGNSYAQTAGQQQYQNYMQELNNMVPTLANMAYSRYQDEGNQLRQNYDMTKDRYNDEYNVYRDAMSDYQADRSYLASRYEADRDYDRRKYESDREYDFSKWKYLMGLS